MDSSESINKCKHATLVSLFIPYLSGHGCSKLMTSLVNERLKFQMLISQICQYCLLKNVRSFCSASFSSEKASLMFQQKISVYLVIML